MRLRRSKAKNKEDELVKDAAENSEMQNDTEISEKTDADIENDTLNTTKEEEELSASEEQAALEESDEEISDGAEESAAGSVDETSDEVQESAEESEEETSDEVQETAEESEEETSDEVQETAEESDEETSDEVQESAEESEEETSDEAQESAEESEEEQPILQTIIGFENTEPIQTELKKMIDNHGVNIIQNNMQFVGLINDYLPDYDRERRLLVNAANIGVLKNMISDDKRDIAIMRARSLIMDELYVIENAAEFVLACFTYMLGWVYESEFRVIDEENDTESEPEEPEKAEPDFNLSVETKVFTKFDAFKYRLTRKIVIPQGFTKLEDFCFDGNTWMRTITLPSTVLAIGSYAFSACKHLKGIVLPERLKRIEANAFSQCTDLAMVKIPKGVLEIDDNAFSFCTSLKSIDVPTTVSSIGLEAFSCCTALKKIFLPESVKFIDTDAFLNCPDITVYCYENSYVHRYCAKNEINVKIAAVGSDLHSIDVEDGED